jgi:hypothetical protein
MSQENVEIVRRCCEAFNRGDYEGALDALDPEIEYDLRHFPDGRVYRGHQGVREAFPFGVWALEDGRVARIHFYGTKVEALEAVGLSE